MISPLGLEGGSQEMTKVASLGEFACKLDTSLDTIVCKLLMSIIYTADQIYMLITHIATHLLPSMVVKVSTSVKTASSPFLDSIL